MKTFLFQILLFLVPATVGAQDVMLLINDKTLACDVLGYSNGLLSVKLPDGVVVQDRISKVKTIQFMEHPKIVEKQYDPVEVNVTLKDICETQEQRDELARFAQDAYANVLLQKVQSISIQRYHPGDHFDIVVYFEPRQITDANSKFGEIFEYPYAHILHPSLHKMNTETNGWVAGAVKSRITHRFQLKNSTKFLYLDPNLPYNEVKNFLLALESGNFQIEDGEDEENLFLADIATIPIDEIFEVRGKVGENQIFFSIMTSFRGGLLGYTYTFVKRGEIYFLTSMGHWVADLRLPNKKSATFFMVNSNPQTKWHGGSTSPLAASLCGPVAMPAVNGDVGPAGVQHQSPWDDPRIMAWPACNPGVEHQSPGLCVFAPPWVAREKNVQPRRGCTLPGFAEGKRIDLFQNVCCPFKPMEGARPRAPHEHGFNEKHAAKPSINQTPACGGRGRPPSMRGSGTRLLFVPFKHVLDSLNHFHRTH